MVQQKSLSFLPCIIGLLQLSYQIIHLWWDLKIPLVLLLFTVMAYSLKAFEHLWCLYICFGKTSTTDPAAHCSCMYHKVNTCHLDFMIMEIVDKLAKIFVEYLLSWNVCRIFTEALVTTIFSFLYHKSLRPQMAFVFSWGEIRPEIYFQIEQGSLPIHLICSFVKE